MGGVTQYDGKERPMKPSVLAYVRPLPIGTLEQSRIAFQQSSYGFGSVDFCVSSFPAHTCHWSIRGQDWLPSPSLFRCVASLALRKTPIVPEGSVLSWLHLMPLASCVSWGRRRPTVKNKWRRSM